MSDSSDELLRVEGLSKFFPVVRGVFGKTVGQVRAVDDVSFTLRRGETLGLVGESGCGKTTAGRALLRLLEPTRGKVWFDGVEITALTQRELSAYRRRMQIVFQDPFGSLNPRMRVMDIVGEAVEHHGVARGAAVEAHVRELMQKVGLSPRWIHRYPHEFSGGQRQRIGIARAIAVSPELIVCDEAVSALDVSIQAQVINLLIDLRRDMNLAYLFIAHDLSVVRHISDRVAVMYLGEIVELAPCAALFERPAHPYTRALLSAIPEPDPKRRKKRVVLTGDVPTPLDPPSGCHFHPRCPAALDRCSKADPPLVQLEGGRRLSRCVHAEGLESESDWFDVFERRVSDAMIARARQEVTERTPLPALSSLPLQTPGRPEPAPERSDEAQPKRFRGVSGLIVFVLGFVSIMLGRFGLGSIVMIAGGLMLFVSPPAVFELALGRRPLMKLAVVIALTLLVSLSLDPWRRRVAARSDLRWLDGEIAAYERNVGQLPETLAPLRWRTIERFGSRPPRDPWGHPYRYELDEAGKAFALSSVGSDGVPSDDDVNL